MWKNQGSWNFFHTKLIPNSSSLSNTHYIISNHKYSNSTKVVKKIKEYQPSICYNVVSSIKQTIKDKCKTQVNLVTFS